MNPLNAFSADYQAARMRFREAASRLGWRLEAHAIQARGPLGEELTIDVAISSPQAARVLVVSSGLHGVEGFFGSAVQVAQLERWAATERPSLRCVFIHALNPYGFAWLRRVDENNVDPNRNFLLAAERFEGAPENYVRLDPFLNLRRPPARWDMFALQALPLILRHGVPALRQAIAGGQHSYPRGLFYGGAGPSRSHLLLAEHMPRWLAGSETVVHLDFHTGLGPSAQYKLLIDYPLSERQRRHLTDWFGADSFRTAESSHLAYEARGGLGRWCVSRGLAPEYLFAFAEFGTYGPLRMVAGLRAENQAHQWGTSSDPSTLRAKERLRELFCPADPGWRVRVIGNTTELLARAQRGLESRPD